MLGFLHILHDHPNTTICGNTRNVLTVIFATVQLAPDFTEDGAGDGQEVLNPQRFRTCALAKLGLVMVLFGFVWSSPHVVSTSVAQVRTQQTTSSEVQISGPYLQ